MASKWPLPKLVLRQVFHSGMTMLPTAGLVLLDVPILVAAAIVAFVVLAWELQNIAEGQTWRKTAADAIGWSLGILAGLAVPLAMP